MTARILVIDDTESNRYTFRRYLENEGYTVSEARSGAEGLAAALEGRPDLILLDVKLPDILGFEVCRRLKADPRTEATPVLQTSAAFTRSDDRVTGADSGADGYLRMPLEPGELVASVKSLLRMNRAERTAARLSDHLKSTLTAIRDGICLIDERGRIEMTNAAFAHFMAVDPKAEGGPLFAQLVGRKGIDAITLFRALESGQRETSEHKIEGRSWRMTIDPFTVEGDSRAAVCILADVTEERRAEAAVREREKRFRHLAHAIPQLVWILDSSGNFAYANERWVTHTGVATGSFSKWLDVVHPDDRAAAENAWEQARTSGSSLEIEQRLWDAQAGRYTWFLTRAVPDDRYGSAEAQWFFTATEIELQKRATIAHQRAKEEAEAANRTKSAFLSNMSHEIRTPLTTIIGFAETLAGAPKEHVDQAAALIHSSAMDLLATLNSVLDLARLEGRNVEYKSEAVDLAELSVSLARQMESQVPGGVVFEHTVPDQPVIAWVDRSAVLRILTNLLSNAFKFTDSGSVKLRLELLAGAARFSVEDTGIGIPADFVSRLFEPFQRAESPGGKRREGFGLGLSITRELVSLIGGQIEVESTPDQGTTFFVTIPLSDPLSKTTGAKVEAVGPGNVRLQSEPADRRRVLVVDDNENIIQLVHTMIGSEHEIISVDNIEDARRFAATSGIETILLDINLNGAESGVELMKELRADPRHEHTPIIAFTALAFPEDRERLLRSGFTDYLRKPFTHVQLQEVLQRCNV